MAVDPSSAVLVIVFVKRAGRVTSVIAPRCVRMIAVARDPVSVMGRAIVCQAGEDRMIAHVRCNGI